MEVTTPKLPPPPRSAQNSSGCSSADARTRSPRAVTSSTASMLSTVRTCLRSSQPEPPPRASPATPVLETRPPAVPGAPAAARGQPVRLRGGVDRGPRHAAADARDPALGVDRDLVEAAHVDTAAVVDEAQAGDRVAECVKAGAETIHMSGRTPAPQALFPRGGGQAAASI